MIPFALLVVGAVVVAILSWSTRHRDPLAGLSVSSKWIADHTYGDRPANHIGVR